MRNTPQILLPSETLKQSITNYNYGPPKEQAIFFLPPLCIQVAKMCYTKLGHFAILGGRGRGGTYTTRFTCLGYVQRCPNARQDCFDGRPKETKNVKKLCLEKRCYLQHIYNTYTLDRSIYIYVYATDNCWAPNLMLGEQRTPGIVTLDWSKEKNLQVCTTGDPHLFFYTHKHTH